MFGCPIRVKCHIGTTTCSRLWGNLILCHPLWFNCYAIGKGKFWQSIYLNPSNLCKHKINNFVNLVCTDTCNAGFCKYSIKKQSSVKKKYFQTMPEASSPAKTIFFSVSMIHFPGQPVMCFHLALALALQEKTVRWEIHSNYFYFYYFCLPLQAGQAFLSFIQTFP